MSKKIGLGSNRVRSVGIGVLPLLFFSCVSYQAEPVELSALLSQLERTKVKDLLAKRGEEKKAALGIRDAVLLALRANPGLRAFRAQLKVAKLGVEAAGLFPDIELGWDAMDVVATETTGGKAEAEQFLSGLGLSFRLPRPGELSAEKDFARAKSEEASQTLLEAQWRLALQTSFAWLRVKRMEAALKFQEEALKNAGRLADFFVQAREMGAATSMEKNLALAEQAKIQAEFIRQKGEEQRARRKLNLLLGVSPEERFPLEGIPGGLWDDTKGGMSLLCKKALELRPDLGRLMARYQQAEESLRLEIAKQWPGLWIGTGITLSLPLFSGFNGPQIDVAKALREKRREDLLAAVHRVRAEIAEALARKNQANQVWDVLKTRLLPAAEQNLKVLREAFDSGRVTLLETLIGQRQIIDARLQELDARVERLEASLSLRWACGDISLGLDSLIKTEGKKEETKKTKEGGK
ncbi:MAG TPA: TolC family protein [Planctomycetes bacterium]|nr:TolC family protein [Planctomycetota bacterium]